jgi:BMFP domain-containing protein YqiC
MESTTSTGSQFGMIDLGHIDELARRLGSLVPPGLRGHAHEELREELQQNFKSVLQSGLGRLDLVTREEFDVQRAVLLRTREQLEALQRTVVELEAQLGNSQAPGTSQA